MLHHKFFRHFYTIAHVVTMPYFVCCDDFDLDATHADIIVLRAFHLV